MVTSVEEFILCETFTVKKIAAKAKLVFVDACNATTLLTVTVVDTTEEGRVAQLLLEERSG